MTREEAEAKVAASGGTLSIAKNRKSPGGFRTRSIESIRRYEVSEKRREVRRRYAVSEKMREVHRRYNVSEKRREANLRHAVSEKRLLYRVDYNAERRRTA